MQKRRFRCSITDVPSRKNRQPVTVPLASCVHKSLEVDQVVEYICHETTAKHSILIQNAGINLLVVKSAFTLIWSEIIRGIPQLQRQSERSDERCAADNCNVFVKSCDSTAFTTHR
jgi:hypothetical protein